jgi:hypothetical protein
VIGVRGPASFTDAPGVEPRAEFRRRVAALTETMALPDIVRVRIPAGASSLFASYQCLPGTKLTGRLVRSPANAPITAAVAWVEGYFADADAHLTDGIISMTGVPTDPHLACGRVGIAHGLSRHHHRKRPLRTWGLGVDER